MHLVLMSYMTTCIVWLHSGKHMANHFDLVISITTLHNLEIFDLARILPAIERVGQKGYVVVESYRNDQELFSLQCWALTCQAFFNTREWEWLFGHFGYHGDFEFIYFE